MFTSFNSLCVYVAHSLDEQAALRELFEENALEYSVSIKDVHAPEGFYPAISPEMLFTQTIDYLFLVHKKDATRARELLETKWHWEESAEPFSL